MSAFDDLMQEATDAGVDPEWVERVKAASAGSPLRKERDAAVERNKALEAENAKYRTTSLAAALQSLGAEVKLDALKVPDDLDPSDLAKVTEWAVDMKLVKPPEPTAEEQQLQAELDGLEAVAAAANGQQRTPSTGLVKPSDVESWPTDKLMRLRQQHPDAFEALKRGEPVQVPNFA